MEAKDKKYIQDCYPTDMWIEIAFKAGREEERKFILQNTDRDIRARKEGIREVVEWIEAKGFKHTVLPDVWQAKLKEWGIKPKPNNVVGDTPL